jgi:hypothetical protein
MMGQVQAYTSTQNVLEKRLRVLRVEVALCELQSLIIDLERAFAFIEFNHLNTPSFALCVRFVIGFAIDLKKSAVD